MAHKKIAIQGTRGSFHEMAALKFFEDTIECVPCETFKDLFDVLKRKESDYGVMAIENTVAGTILPNYAMLRSSDMQVIGEIYLPIQQNLLALPGQKIEDIKEVYSHPMAILQCHTFFEKYPDVKLIEFWDTADSARLIAEKGTKGLGAIAGTHAASVYGLEVLVPGIETNKKNFTRFLVIKDKNLVYPAANPDKASVCFNVAHTKGSLAKILTVLADYGLNLTKIQSLPILGKEWEYYIHIDLEFEDHKNFKKVMDMIRPQVHELKILGEYKKGEKTV
jgi:prephenate dehydratase